MHPSPARAAAPVPRCTSVLMCAPDHFDVIDVKNVFMQGQAGRVHVPRARAQWRNLRDTYAGLGVTVHEIPALPGCEDMVFCANPAAVFPRADGGADVVLSRMNHPSRAREVDGFRAWFAAAGFAPRELPADAGQLEGHGDVLCVPGRRLALGGHGGRSRLSAIAALQLLVDVPVVPLAMTGEIFYHLDTCVAVLDDETVLVHPPALRDDARATLAALFPRCIEADPQEAREHLAVNVHALADGHVLVPAQAPRTAERIERAGFRPVLVDVSEFHKSGGSIFCMRMDLPALPRVPAGRPSA